MSEPVEYCSQCRYGMVITYGYQRLRVTSCARGREVVERHSQAWTPQKNPIEVPACAQAEPKWRG